MPRILACLEDAVFDVVGAGAFLVATEGRDFAVGVARRLTVVADFGWVFVFRLVAIWFSLHHATASCAATAARPPLAKAGR